MIILVDLHYVSIFQQAFKSTFFTEEVLKTGYFTHAVDVAIGTRMKRRVSSPRALNLTTRPYSSLSLIFRKQKIW